MKAEQRAVYLELIKANTGWQLCSICKTHESHGSFCSGDGYNACTHPLTERVDFPTWLDGYLEPGADCWAFRPMYPVAVIADIIGIVIAEGWEAAGWYENKEGVFLVSGT